MMLVSDRTRRGCSMAIVCAIIPPIDTPATWADSRPRWSRSANASAAMSARPYGVRTCRPENARMSMVLLTRPATLVDRPVSRLS